MATHASAEKAARQSAKRAEKNRKIRSQFRTIIKKARATLATKHASKDAAVKALQPIVNEVQSVLMRAANKGIIKKATASRKIARLSHHVSKLGA